MTKSDVKAHKNDRYINSSLKRNLKNYSPSEDGTSIDIPPPKIPHKQNVLKNIRQKLHKINKNLDPRFKLAKVDIEELQSSHALQLGEWNRSVSPELVMNLMKEERRKEYWKRRIKATNPHSHKSLDMSK